MTSHVVPYLEVASNDKWLLYGSLNETKIENLNIKLNKRNYLKIENIDGIDLKIEPVLLAQGNKTVGENTYWASIPFELTIIDFTKIQSGKIDFPVTFSIITSFTTSY